MKAVLYLAIFGLIACLLIWSIGNIEPKNQWEYVKSYVCNIGEKISTHVSDLTSSASKLKDRLILEYNIAADSHKNSVQEELPETFGFKP